MNRGSHVFGFLIYGVVLYYCGWKSFFFLLKGKKNSFDLFIQQKLSVLYMTFIHHVKVPAVEKNMSVITFYHAE